MPSVGFMPAGLASKSPRRFASNVATVIRDAGRTFAGAPEPFLRQMLGADFTNEYLQLREPDGTDLACGLEPGEPSRGPCRLDIRQPPRLPRDGSWILSPCAVQSELDGRAKLRRCAHRHDSSFVEINETVTGIGFVEIARAEKHQDARPFAFEHLLNLRSSQHVDTRPQPPRPSPPC